MCLNLNDYQFKTSRYSYTSTHINSMIIKIEKPAINAQKLERKEHKPLLKETIKPEIKKLKEEKNIEEL